MAESKRSVKGRGKKMSPAAQQLSLPERLAASLDRIHKRKR